MSTVTDLFVTNATEEKVLLDQAVREQRLIKDLSQDQAFFCDPMGLSRV